MIQDSFFPNILLSREFRRDLLPVTHYSQSSNLILPYVKLDSSFSI